MAFLPLLCATAFVPKPRSPPVRIIDAVRGVSPPQPEWVRRIQAGDTVQVKETSSSVYKGLTVVVVDVFPDTNEVKVTGKKTGESKSFTQKLAIHHIVGFRK